MKCWPFEPLASLAYLQPSSCIPRYEANTLSCCNWHTDTQGAKEGKCRSSILWQEAVAISLGNWGASTLVNCNVHPALSSPVLTKDGFISRSKKTSKLLTSVIKTKLTKRENYIKC